MAAWSGLARGENRRRSRWSEGLSDQGCPARIMGQAAIEHAAGSSLEEAI